jgi:hypothetical protein
LVNLLEEAHGALSQNALGFPFELLTNATRTNASRAAGNVLTFEDDGTGHARLREVKCNGASYDSSADDGYVRR